MGHANQRLVRVRPLETEPISRGWKRSALVEKVSDGIVESEFVLWFEVESEEIDPPDPEDAESFVLALLVMGMEEGRDLEVAGRCSARLISNLEEFSAAWNSWSPKSFRPVAISATGYPGLGPAEAARPR